MKEKIYCLPYAGGSANVFFDWIKEYEEFAELNLVEYAGRGRRFGEDYFKTIEEASADLCAQIKENGDKDFILFGYSMGCIIALETAFQLKKIGIKPKAIIVAATRPPHLMYRDKILDTMTKDELMEETASWGQMDDEIMKNEELYEIVSDIMYADVQMFSKYKRDYQDEKIDIPIFAMSGNDDFEAPAEDMKEWSLYTENSFEFCSFSGGHFFAFDDCRKVKEQVKFFVENNYKIKELNT
ncbi:thioesterase II family protein [uncultured Eubacterium sp.]|uniref:thioesterase II family protein n=1 Tax=uncultured Eubacterium sp. TaxID=165185 RepID=UPI002596A33C|nr:thioesterase domain-containing protein [uncultured Eubacterium sp.]